MRAPAVFPDPRALFLQLGGAQGRTTAAAAGSPQLPGSRSPAGSSGSARGDFDGKGRALFPTAYTLRPSKSIFRYTNRKATLGLSDRLPPKAANGTKRRSFFLKTQTGNADWDKGLCGFAIPPPQGLASSPERYRMRKNRSLLLI